MIDRKRTLVINEIFGVTFQGEGKNLGMPCVFLRLGGCNLSCKWCDTPYTWNWQIYDPKTELHPMSIEDVYEKLSLYPVRNLVISGGEPMLQQKNLLELTKMLHKDKWHTEIETAGTIKPITTELVKHFTVSPKLSNSGNDWSKRYRPDALKLFNLAPSHCFKFVVSKLSDFEEIDQIVKELRLSNIYIMPEGITDEVIKRISGEVANEAIKRNYNITTRLHVSVFGNRRGV